MRQTEEAARTPTHCVDADLSLSSPSPARSAGTCEDLLSWLARFRFFLKIFLGHVVVAQPRGGHFVNGSQSPDNLCIRIWIGPARVAIVMPHNRVQHRPCR